MSKRTVPAVARTKPCGCPELQSAISRRSFLKRTAGAGLVAGIASQGMFTRLAFAGAPYDGDVLVILSLRGGFDGLNAIVPVADPEYPLWRPNIGIPVNHPGLYQLDATFGMHPAMAPLQPFWEAGSFGVVHAVGMAQPNRSHFQAMEEMERAAPGTSVRTGWIDRVLGLRDTGTAFQGVQMGSNLAASAFLGNDSSELAMWSVDSFGLDAAGDDAERRGGTRRCGRCTPMHPRSSRPRPRRHSMRCRRRRRCRRPATRRSTARRTRRTPAWAMHCRTSHG